MFVNVFVNVFVNCSKRLQNHPKISRIAVFFWPYIENFEGKRR